MPSVLVPGHCSERRVPIEGPACMLPRFSSSNDGAARRARLPMLSGRRAADLILSPSASAWVGQAALSSPPPLRCVKLSCILPFSASAWVCQAALPSPPPLARVKPCRLLLPSFAWLTRSLSIERDCESGCLEVCGFIGFLPPSYAVVGLFRAALRSSGLAYATYICGTLVTLQCSRPQLQRNEAALLQQVSALCALRFA